MYEARQNKEKVSRRIEKGNIKARNIVKMKKSVVIQNVKDKFAENDTSFNEGFQTGLYAEHNDGTDIFPVIAWNSKSGHAEENLLSCLEQNNRTGGDLSIWLSTSPCSSTYGTGTGCQEKLEDCGMNVKVTADHYYQPKGTGLEHPKQASIEAAKNSSIPIEIKEGTLQLSNSTFI